MGSRLAAVTRNPNSIGALFRKDYGSMEAYFRLASFFHARTASKRVAATQEIGRCELKIPEVEGFLRVDALQDAVSVGALQRAREILAAHDFKALEQAAKKQFLIQIELDPSEESHWPIFDFALSRPIVDPIATYLGILPILTGAHVWYSPNKIFESGRSQEFHLDGADAKQVKLFLFLDDVDEDSGPLTGIPADASRKIYDRLREAGAMERVNVKIPDPVIFELLKEIGSEPVAFTGKAGDMVLVDTCRCMHFGSRPSKGKSKPRKVVMLHYTRPYAPDLPLFGRLAKAPTLLNSKPEKERERLEYLLGVRR
jgi:hypothetical protein